jgi:tRNA-2-methylthio-N6-dimethylallyladenosine synthase
MEGSFSLVVFGCQMNQHDAQKISNLLYHRGFRPAAAPAEADLVLVYTCSVREKAEHKLYTEIGELARLKARRPDLLLGVGGCVAQQEGAALLELFPRLDFVFGPQNLRHLPAMIDAARERERSAWVGYDADPQARFDLPEQHPEYSPPTPGRAFVTVMEGCDLFCSFCVVPRTRGREVSRPWGEILRDVESHARAGALEVTLLGQTVNAYGRPRPGGAGDEISFADLLRRVAAVPGIRRVRFTSPHPIFVGPDLVDCYADLEPLCPHLHLPVQSGSSRVLAAMNRRYDREAYLGTVARLREARPDLALTTDLIVGFPGETEADFEETLDLVREAGFEDSFSFKYSPRPGTPAVRRGLPEVDPEEAQDRLERLQALQRVQTLRAHARRIGERTEVLVEGPSRRGGTQWTGRCPKNRVVNFTSEGPTAPGTLLDVVIQEATPHSLIAVPAAEAASRPLPLLGGR